MRNLLPAALTLFAPLTLLVACDDKPPPGGPPTPETCAGATHPLDHALCAELYDAGYRPQLAGDAELCTRLFVDLLGIRAPAEQLRSDCIGQPLDTVVGRIQESEAYRRAARRRWADRLSYSDALVDAGSIHDLDRLVEDLYQGRTSYRDFAIMVLAHPGFVGRFVGYGQPDLVAEAAFRAFLGRPATRPEAIDLSNLWRPWIGNTYVRLDGAADRAAIAPPYGYGGVPLIDPQACAAGVNACESTLLGPATIAFPADGRVEYIAIADLTAADWESLRTPGRLFAGLDAFWEAEVDAELQRLLGYDLGSLRPKARQALVDLFKRNGGDVRELERIVLTSWAYRQTADEIASSPRPESLRQTAFAYGPTKLMIAEDWLHSIGAVIGRDLGECDWRYPNLPDAALPPETIDPLQDVYPRDGSGAMDTTFRDSARVLGGCPGAFDYGSFSVTGRTGHIGLITAVAQEEELVKLCFLGDVPALMPPGLDPADHSAAAIEATVRHVMGRIEIDPTDPQVAEAVSAVIDNCTDCDVEATARGLCSGLLGGIAFMTY